MIERVDGGVVDRNFAAILGSLVETGLIAIWPVPAALPDGWVKCDGGVHKRAELGALFALIGTTFGVGDGSTTFGVPSIASPGASLVYVIKV